MTKTSAPETAPAPAAAMVTSTGATVRLSRPINRENAEPVTTLTLREPQASELRGLKMQELMQSDVNSIITLVPRICQPFITSNEVASLCAPDFAEVCGAIFGFFMNQTDMAMIQQMMGG